MSADPAMGEYFPGATEPENKPATDGSLPGSDLPARGLYNNVNLQVYHYAGNNPVKYSDPNGEWVQIAVGAGIGAVAGGIIAGVKAANSGGSAGDIAKAAGIGALKGGFTGAVVSAGGSLMGAAAGSAAAASGSTTSKVANEITKEVMGGVVGTVVEETIKAAPEVITNGVNAAGNAIAKGGERLMNDAANAYAELENKVTDPAFWGAPLP